MVARMSVRCTQCDSLLAHIPPPHDQVPLCRGCEKNMHDMTEYLKDMVHAAVTDRAAAVRMLQNGGRHFERGQFYYFTCSALAALLLDNAPDSAKRPDGGLDGEGLSAWLLLPWPPSDKTSFTLTYVALEALTAAMKLIDIGEQVTTSKNILQGLGRDLPIAAAGLLMLAGRAMLVTASGRRQEGHA